MFLSQRKNICYLLYFMQSYFYVHMLINGVDLIVIYFIVLMNSNNIIYSGVESILLFFNVEISRN